MPTQNPPSPLATAAGAGSYPTGTAAAPTLPQPTVAPAGGYSGSYVGQQNGGVTGGGGGIGDALLGQDNTRVSPSLISTLPDASDQAIVQRAQADYDQQHLQWERLNNDPQYQYQIQSHFFDLLKTDPGAANQFMQQMKDLRTNEPKPPDLAAIQAQSDRERLLSEAKNVYQPLISSELSTALGQGPSAAESVYKAAADNSQRRAYGMAASANGSGGQRASLFQAALGQAALGQQSAANAASGIRSQEVSNARQAVGGALQGLTDIYGRTNLYGGTLDVQGRNQDAQNNANNTNAGISSANAANQSSAIKSYYQTTGELAGGL